MPNFTLDRTGLIFVTFSLVVACWAVFDTRRFMRLLSLNRKTTFTRFELMAIRVPGMIVLFGASLMIVTTLLQRGLAR